MQGKALELTWRYALYNRISWYRDQFSRHGDQNAIVSATNCCLEGILYFKQLLIQICHCYAKFNIMADLQLGMSEEAQKKAIDGILTLNPTLECSEADVMSIVQMCFVKMGDLAR